MSSPRPRVRVPDTATAGEEVAIRALISHPMESGLRRNTDGSPIPRKIINRFVCTFNGEQVVDFRIDPGIAANPYFEFSARVPESGTFRFEWTDDDGVVTVHEHEISVG